MFLQKYVTEAEMMMGNIRLEIEWQLFKNNLLRSGDEFRDPEYRSKMDKFLSNITRTNLADMPRWSLEYKESIEEAVNMAEDIMQKQRDEMKRDYEAVISGLRQRQGFRELQEYRDGEMKAFTSKSQQRLENNISRFNEFFQKKLGECVDSEQLQESESCDSEPDSRHTQDDLDYADSFLASDDEEQEDFLPGLKKIVANKGRPTSSTSSTSS
ncbi:hypothetical protein WJX72_003253 [[Myrmecia] bisecta]|uniref:Uncharacterized protein n=1 Tax=[Myrmecia] bisecta TaxID=41462 RepID=A0AAW1PWB6_9CHLO